ncbi:hypothetical protein [Actinokineospora globicatena]|uniref:Uncharacterized protein n=1 Tax=Actinokineospora globicatena TaxID=103729 RepID=A0A9W6QKT2_9PSEU|nr:hypothetical protein [Actinokineospora globicatena]GLW90043.1 hypothetical protein Aglo03_08590 [Actinokineospora globicatena]
MNERLLALATDQYATIEDPAVFTCWHVLVEAIGKGWLTSLDTLISILESGGGGVAAEEYGVDVFGEEVEISLVSDHFTCSRTALLHEVRKLEVAVILRTLTTLTTTDTEIGRQARTEAAAYLSTRDSAAPDELRRAAELLTPQQQSELTAALRTFNSWAEHHTAGEEVDRLIATLERTLGPLLEHGREASRTATDIRIATDAENAIARRVREAGTDTPTA